MIIAKVKPDEPQELTFDLSIEGTKENPTDIRFIIESMEFDDETVQDVFSVICRAVRTNDSIKVYVPRLLNLFRAGSYRARLEVVLENRLFVPLNEEIEIEPPVLIHVPIKETKKIEPHKPEVRVALNTVVNEVLGKLKNKPVKEEVSNQEVSNQEVSNQKLERINTDTKPKKKRKSIPEIDTSWKYKGFDGYRNPFSKEL